MFKKKFSTREAQSVGKGNAKTLRVEVLDVIGKDNGELFDLVIGKKIAVTKTKHQCGSSASAFVYSVNDVPFFISVDRLADEEQSLITDGRPHRYSIVPTVFFFLRLHQLLADKKEQWTHFVSDAGVAVTCFGPTSRFLLNGAHLMMPGIIHVRAKTTASAGDVALVYTHGVDVPYAVGFVTDNLVSQRDAGVGVYIVQCFRDNLWQEHANRFMVNYSLSSNAPLIPSQFGENEVAGEPSANPQPEEPAEAHGSECAEVESSAYEGKNRSADIVTLFEDEDAVLSFCLCEAVKQLSCSMLPLPLPQFTSIVVQSFPRDGVHTEPIQFKDTKYKRALSFFQQYPELLTITETGPGAYSVLSVNKFAAVMRQHAAKNKSFVETEHREACEKEARALQAKIIENGTAVFRQSVVSAGVFYAAPHNLDEDLVRLLLLGEDPTSPEDVHFPTLDQVTNGTAPECEPTPIDRDIFDELYTRKALMDNLKKYVQTHSLLVINTAGKGRLPNVRIDKVLSKLFSSEDYAPELPLDKVEVAMLRLFKTKCEIILQTVMEGSSLASENMVPKRICRSGGLPKVSVRVKRVKNNKVVTVVRNLDALGFDLNLLARQWRKQFSCSCSVVDPVTKKRNFKLNTDFPLEINLQGNLIAKVKAALLNEANLPPSVLVSREN